MQNQEVAGPSNDEPEDVCLVHSWDLLPLCALERIFFFLKPLDRSKASIVCASWAETFESPSLWRSPVLSFSQGNRSTPCFDPDSIVQRFGRYFRNMTIKCRTARRRTHKKENRMMSHFFDLLLEGRVQLESFRMPRLMVMSIISMEHSEHISIQMTNFLRTQTGLHTVDFTNGSTHTAPGIELLESLVAENVRHLKMQNLFHYPFELEFLQYSERFERAMIRFRNLRSLWLNYGYLSDLVIASLAERLEGHLEELGILAEYSLLSSGFVSDDNWIALKTKCPRMIVHFRLELGRERLTEVVRREILSPQMPVVSMQYVNPVPWNQTGHSIFDYLRSTFAETLRDVDFDLQGTNELCIRTGIMDMVNSCYHLETLALKLRFPLFEIQELLDGVYETLQQMNNGMTSLKNFRTTFRGLHPLRRDTRIHLQRTYIPKFNDIGVKLKILMKP